MGVILRGHPVRGDSHIQRNANREVATIEIISSYAAKYFWLLQSIDTKDCQLSQYWPPNTRYKVVNLPEHK